VNRRRVGTILLLFKQAVGDTHPSYSDE